MLTGAASWAKRARWTRRACGGSRSALSSSPSCEVAKGEGGGETRVRARERGSEGGGGGVGGGVERERERERESERESERQRC
jgi:hypothetical protein